MALCFVENLGAHGGVTVGIGLPRALQCDSGGRLGFDLAVLHFLGRWLMVKLRLDRLGRGRAAYSAG